MASDETLDILRAVQSSLAKIEAYQAAHTARMEMLESQVGELTRTVRGYNGTTGLVTEVALLRDVISRETEQQHQRDEKQDAKAQKEDTKGALTYQTFAEKFVAPVVTPAVVAIIIYIIFNVIPHITAGVP